MAYHSTALACHGSGVEWHDIACGRIDKIMAMYIKSRFAEGYLPLFGCILLDKCHKPPNT